jgi:hypothetical protein
MKRIILLMIAVAGTSAAQDFGYEYAMLSEYRALAVSRNFQDFSPRSTVLPSVSGPISFNTSLPFIEYRQNNGRLAAGYQTYSYNTGKSGESFSVYGESRSDFSLFSTRQEQGNWFIPIAVGANYVRADGPDKSVKRFDVGSFGLGSGITFKYFSRTIGFQAFVLGSMYYASEGFGTAYGWQRSLSGELQVIVPEWVYEGMLFGIRYEAQEWEMSDNALDYQRMYSGLFIGILF